MGPKHCVLEPEILIYTHKSIASTNSEISSPHFDVFFTTKSNGFFEKELREWSSNRTDLYQQVFLLIKNVLPDLLMVLI